MTKKEQAEMLTLRNNLAVARAMRFTEMIEPDIPRPSGYTDKDMTRGWLYNATMSGYNACVRAEKACSTSVSHGRTQHEPPLL